MQDMTGVRRRCLAAGLVLGCAVAASTCQAADFFPDRVFVTLKDSGELARYPGPDVWQGEPVMLYDALTPDGRRLVVSSPRTRHIYVFDTRSGRQLARVAVGRDAKGVKVSPNGREAYVANEGDSSVSVVDLESYENVATIRTAAMPHNIRFSTDGSRAYVTLQGGAGLGVIDTRRRAVIRVIATPGLDGPHNLDLGKAGRFAYIRDTGHRVGVLDLDSDRMVKLIDVGQGHAGIDVSPDGSRVYTGAIADEVVTVIDTDSLSVSARIPVGFGPHGVRVSRDGRWLYVAVTAADRFVVIDSRTLEVAATFRRGDFPFWIAVAGNP